jgi:hypothetical protein
LVYLFICFGFVFNNFGFLSNHFEMEPSDEQVWPSQDVIVAWLVPDPEPENYVYNIPDAYELDSNIIRAEMMFFSNPQSQSFSGEAYYALKNVHDECQVDYQKYCIHTKLSFDDTQAMMEKLFSYSLPFLMNRRLRETGESITVGKYSGRKLLQFMRSFYVPKVAENAKVSTVNNDASVPTGKTTLHLEKADKTDRRKAVGAHSHLMRGTDNTKLQNMIKQSAEPHQSRRLHSPYVAPEFSTVNSRNEPGREHPRPPPSSGPYYPRDPPKPPKQMYDDDYDESDMEDDDDNKNEDAVSKTQHEQIPHRNSDEPHEDQNQIEDSYFAGALGYGASGDFCLHENAEMLSPPCAQAIGNVYALREQYWTTYSDAQKASLHHHHPVFGLFVIGFFFIILLKRIMYAPRRRQIKSFLSALNDKPELKAQLESQLNMEIPKPRSGTCCGGERRSCLRRFCFALGYVLFAVVASVFITVTSLEMTAGIVDGMESGKPPDAPPTSPFFVLFILMLIVVGQLVLLRLAMRTVSRLWHRHCGATIEDNTGQYEDSDSSPPSSNNGSGRAGLHVEFQRLAHLPVSFYREFVSPRVSSLFAARESSEGYAPLRSGEDEREMTAVGRQVTPSHSQPAQYAVYTGVPINPNSVVNMTARPVSAVNLV